MGAKTGNNGVPTPRGGGKKGRSGRKPFAITALCANVLDKYKLIELVKDIAVGDIWEQWTNNKGEIVTGPTKNSDRLAAIRFLTEYAVGKPPQPITGPDGGPIALTIKLVRE